MFRLHPPSGARDSNTSGLISRNLFSTQRSVFGDRMFTHGCYHDLIGRSLCYLQQAAPLRFRSATIGQEASAFRHIPGTDRLQDCITGYSPFDARLNSNKSAMLDALRNNLVETGKQLSLTDGLSSADKETLMSSSGYPGNSADTLVTTSTTSPSESKKSFSCPQCKYSTDRKNNLKRHVITMHFDCDRKLECCGTIFRSKAKLREHVTLFHKNGYRCLVCARMFCRKALLRRHMAVHSGKKDFHCGFCTYATSHKSNLERHQKVHSKSTRLVYSPKDSPVLERGVSTIQHLSGAEVVFPTRTNYIHNVDSERFTFQDNDDESDMNYEDEYIDVSDNYIESKHDEYGAIGGFDPNDYKLNKCHMFYTNLCDSDEPVSNVLHDDRVTGDSNARISTPKSEDGYVHDDEKQNNEENNLDHGKACELDDITSPGQSGEQHVSGQINDEPNTDNQDHHEETAEDAISIETHRRLPRLFGLPYRCASCCNRFESQDRFNKHKCEVDGSCFKEQIEKSVSLVALILKQGKTYNRIGNE